MAVFTIFRTFVLVNAALIATASVIPRVPAGTQFITGPCGSDDDCASGCCNAKTALCAARLVAEEGAGCGFNGTPVAATAAAAPTSAAAAAPAASSAAGSGKPPGTQFITGPCGSDADCASGCCNAQTALCAARLVAEEGAGCGFNGTPLAASSAAAVATSAAAAAPPATSAAATSAAAAATGTQFITGACGSDADCASGCCNAKTALCAARLVAEEGAGCGFNGTPAAANAAAAAPTSAAAAAPPASPAAAAPAAAGTQFITGACGSDAECANGCCGFNSGKCAGAIVAQGRDGGCGHGDAQPNNNAAVALVGPNAPKPGQTRRSLDFLEMLV